MTHDIDLFTRLLMLVFCGLFGLGSCFSYYVGPAKPLQPA
jgi:hypothetical protein